MPKFLIYCALVLIFGAMRSYPHLTSGEDLFSYRALEGFLFMALMWGTIYFNGLALSANLKPRSKTTLILLLSGIAGLVTYWFYGRFGSGEVAENVLIGSGKDISTYKEYPVKGYQILGPVVSILYLAIGLAFSLAPKKD